MKRRVAVGIGVVLICCVALLAGEYLTNEQTAFGLRVIFSEPVTITSFGDVLAQVAPAGESTSFVFFGGQLDPWAGHWLNWEPATATIETVDWLLTPEEAESAADNQGQIQANLPPGESSSSPTYEQIMAEIAEYPGPNEPLYVPAEDEAVWLTDLEGHADIYDNDSIKINYAEWFDQSQITKIEVYRNGVKMRFLPDRLEVLTNNQMKTFDGNPAEHTPASDHTDHAIWGYEYEFRVATSVSTESAVALIEAPFRFTDPYTYQALLDATSQIGKLSDDEMRGLLQRFVAQGWRGISIDQHYYLDSPFSNTLQPDHSRLTYTDTELERILRLAGELGLGTEIRFQMVVSEAYTQVHQDTWCNSVGCRSMIQPSELDVFFDNYTNRCIHLAQLLSRTHGAILTLMVEADSLEVHREYILEMLDTVSQYFAGTLVIHQATNICMNGPQSPDDPSLMDILERASFWDWSPASGRHVDIHMSANTNIIDSTSDQRLSKMTENFLSAWEPAVDYYRQHYPASRVAFGELSAFNLDSGAMLGWPAQSISTTDDYQEASDIMAAAVVASAALGVDGFSYLYNYLLWDADRHAVSAPLVAPPTAPVRRLMAELIGGSFVPFSDEMVPDVDLSGSGTHNVLSDESTEITEELAERFAAEAIGRQQIRVGIRISAKGKPDAGTLPVLQLSANAVPVWEVEPETFTDWRTYTTEIQLPASATVFSVGFALPQRGQQVSVDWVEINGIRYDLESLESYGIFGQPPEVDPTYITFWMPGELAWLVDLGE